MFSTIGIVINKKRKSYPQYCGKDIIYKLKKGECDNL